MTQLVDPHQAHLALAVLGAVLVLGVLLERWCHRRACGARRAAHDRRVAALTDAQVAREFDRLARRLADVG